MGFFASSGRESHSLMVFEGIDLEIWTGHVTANC